MVLGHLQGRIHYKVKHTFPNCIGNHNLLIPAIDQTMSLKRANGILPNLVVLQLLIEIITGSTARCYRISFNFTISVSSWKYICQLWRHNSTTSIWECLMAAIHHLTCIPPFDLYPTCLPVYLTAVLLCDNTHTPHTLHR